MSDAEASTGGLPLEAIIRDPELRADPHPTYHRLRSQTPVLSDPAIGAHLLTRFDDCERVLRDLRFSSNVSRRRLPPGAEAPEVSLADLVADPQTRNLLFLDPPDHTRIRGLVAKAFTPRTVEALRPHIAEITDAVLDRAAEAGSLDVVNELGAEVPITVICELMGVPLEDRHLFRPWSERASHLLDATILTPEELADSALGALALGSTSTTSSRSVGRVRATTSSPGCSPWRKRATASTRSRSAHWSCCCSSPGTRRR